mmetsp:Transcript_3464/g.12583  ORF Transcript_3464/g.12583 Transcript_3464/m.12583 type:complete len:310 (+) Transcript_3464:1462-2391(+)
MYGEDSVRHHHECDENRVRCPPPRQTRPLRANAAADLALLGPRLAEVRHVGKANTSVERRTQVAHDSDTLGVLRRLGHDYEPVQRAKCPACHDGGHDEAQDLEERDAVRVKRHERAVAKVERVAHELKQHVDLGRVAVRRQQPQQAATKDVDREHADCDYHVDIGNCAQPIGQANNLHNHLDSLEEQQTLLKVATLHAEGRTPQGAEAQCAESLAPPPRRRVLVAQPSVLALALAIQVQAFRVDELPVSDTRHAGDSYTHSEGQKRKGSSVVARTLCRKAQPQQAAASNGNDERNQHIAQVKYVRNCRR